MILRKFSIFVLLSSLLPLSVKASEIYVGGNIANGNQEAGAYIIGNVPSAAQTSFDQDHTTGSGSSMRIDLSAPNSLSQWKGLDITGGDITQPVTAGDSITISGWVYVPSATVLAGTAKFNLATRADPGNVTIAAPSVNMATASRDTWHLASLTLNVPAGYTSLKIGHNWNIETVNDPSAYSGYIYVDDISVVNNSIPSPPAPSLPVHGLTFNPSQQDLDSNGLADIWEAIYDAEGINPLADSDGDGVSNGDESKAGTDPFNPNDALLTRVTNDGSGNALVCWPALAERPGIAQSTTDLANSLSWAPEAGSPALVGNEWQLTVPTTDDALFFRVEGSENDDDLDRVPDWLEPYLSLASGAGNPNSGMLPVSYDTTGDGIPDTTLSGDLAAFNEIYRKSETGTQLTRSQASRFLLQASFGASSIAEIDHVIDIGVEAWIDEQIALTPYYYKDYILDIKADWLLRRVDVNNPSLGDPSLAGYADFSNDQNPQNISTVRGINVPTSFARGALLEPDQLRQRVALALSEILVVPRNAAMLANQPEALTTYHDHFIEHAFGNYEDILLDVTLNPCQGHALSSLGNRKKDEILGRFPDENYAREIMQLFSIGLWELNMDGSQKLDVMGDPIPTYSNLDITELARIFTGVNYASATNPNTNFGNGWRDDGDSSGNKWMATPMKIYSSEHDWDTPRPYIVTGNGTTFPLPIRGSQDNANAMLDVVDVVNKLVHHPNCAPFISRQLIQFLITSNPTPGYVQRVATVFSDNGSGITGDLEAVVKAILLDEEARDPLVHLSTPQFGKLREPLIRTMHLARIIDIGENANLRFWDWGNFGNDSLQDFMDSPTVFNFFRPDFRLFGVLADNEFDSPVFQIVDSYSSISFPNRLWSICNNGFKDGNGVNQQEDLTDLEAIAGSVPALLDHLSLLYCGGTLGAESRATIAEALNSTTSLNQRARLGAYLVLSSPEGACQK